MVIMEFQKLVKVFFLFSSLERNRYIYFHQKVVNMLPQQLPSQYIFEGSGETLISPIS